MQLVQDDQQTQTMHVVICAYFFCFGDHMYYLMHCQNGDSLSHGLLIQILPITSTAIEHVEMIILFN